ncbi:trypsin-like serine peptidase [Runella sp.]|uniref:trypsin-like serine peptidase n=1 Tax=Runella sp. TaxID=1960881 RepID=UPI003D150191
MERSRVEDSGLIPYRYICLLEIFRVDLEGNPLTYVSRSTGFLIDKNVIVTAGHSLNQVESRISHFKVYPFINAVLPPTIYRVDIPPATFEIHTIPDYKNPNCYVKDDYGAIVLQTDAVYQQMGGHFDWNENYLFAENLVEHSSIHIAGYPIDKADFEMWGEQGNAIEITKHCLIHSFTTTQRNSGSPIWIEHQGKFIVVGIHVSGNSASCGYRPENREFGSAVLLKKNVYDTISGWITSRNENFSENSFKHSSSTVG